jgi:uncharacterized protein YggE
MRSRWWWGAAGVVAAVALAVGVYGSGLARSPGESGAAVAGGVSVSGEGYVHGKPDTAYLNLGFTAEKPTVAAARQATAANMNAVLAKLLALGVAQRDIQTTNVSIWRDPERKVFVVSNEVRVTVRNVDSAGKLLDDAVRAGANSVNGIALDISDRAALQKQAREKAMRDAEAKAAELARLGKLRLGAVRAISEGSGAPEPMYDAGPVAQAAQPEARMPVEPGQLRVYVTLQVTYAIQP